MVVEGQRKSSAHKMFTLSKPSPSNFASIDSCKICQLHNGFYLCVMSSCMLRLRLTVMQQCQTATALMWSRKWFRMNEPIPQFYVAVVWEIHPFLEQDQCDRLMVPFLGNDVFGLLHALMQRFLKAGVVSGLSSAYQMTRVDIKENTVEVRYLY